MGFPQSGHRYSAASGIAFVVFYVASTLLFGLDFPTYDDAPRKFTTYYVVHSDRIELSALAGAFAVVAFVWFAAFLRWVYARAETGARGFVRATDIGFASAVAAGAVVSVALATAQVSAATAGTVEPGALRAIDLLGDYCFVIGALFLTVWLLSSFFVVRVTKIFPEWLSYLAMLGAAFGVAQSVLFLAPQDDDGVLGFLGLGFGLLLAIWTLAASITLVRRVDTLQYS